MDVLVGSKINFKFHVKLSQIKSIDVADLVYLIAVFLDQHV